MNFNDAEANSQFEIIRLNQHVELLQAALTYAIKVADGWHDEAHGGPISSDAMHFCRVLTSGEVGVKRLLADDELKAIITELQGSE